MQAIWNRFNSIMLVLIALMLAGALARGVFGGSLDPPAPPGSTMKTLDQLEPRIPISQPASAAGFPVVISQPGSYYLTGNITGVSGQDGIHINANDVTLNLNGFALLGVPGSGQGVVPAGWGITVENGSIWSWGLSGIYAGSASNGHYRQLELRSNALVGLSAGGNGGVIVEDSVATNNGEAGFYLGGSGIIRGCYAASNAGDGIYAEGALLVQGNAVRSNGGKGIVASGTDETVSNNAVSANSGGGIWVVGQRSRIEGNTVTGNDAITIPFGIRVTGTHNFIVQNSASYNVDNFDIAAGNTAGPEEIYAATGPWSNVGY